MKTVIGTVKILEGEYFSKDLNGNIVELHVGDVITQGMKVFGAETNPENATIQITMLNINEAINLMGSQAQIFDASLVENENLDDPLTKTSVKQALDTKIYAQEDDTTNKDNTDDVVEPDETAAGEDQSPSGQSIADTFTARDGDSIDVSSTVRSTTFAPREQSDIDELYPLQNTPLVFEMNPVTDFTEDATSVGDTVATVKTATDADGGAITFAINDTSNYAIDASTGKVTLTTTGAATVNAGNDLPAFIVTATSAGVNGSSATDTLNPSVTAVNDAPVITIDSTVNFTEDSGNTVGDRVATFHTSDAEGDTVTVTLSDTTNYALGTGTEAGTVVLTQAGLALVNAGTDLPAFTLIPNDGTIDGNTGNVDPAVTAVNDAPVITIDSTVNFTEDAATNAVGSTVATFHTSDAEGDTVTVTLSDTTNYALGTGADAGKVLLTAAGLALVNTGTDLPAFTLIPNDGTIDGNTGNVDPAVTAVNDAPEVTDKSVTLDSSRDAAIDLSDYSVGGARDQEDDLDTTKITQIKIDTLPTDGILYVNGTAVVQGDIFDETVIFNYEGDIKDPVLFGTKDDIGNFSDWGAYDSSTGDITLDLNGIVGTVSALDGTQDKGIGFKGTDIDTHSGVGIGVANNQISNNEALSINFDTPVANGEIGLSSVGGWFQPGSINGQATWKAYLNGVEVANGAQQQDGSDDGNPNTVVFNVNQPFDSIIFTATSDSRNPDFSIQYIEVHPQQEDNFTYSAIDSEGNPSADSAVVTLIGVSGNFTPDASNDNFVTDEDIPLSIQVADLLANDIDSNIGDTLTIVGVSNPTNGTVVLNNDGTITYTPNVNFNGTATFDYEVSDGNGGTDTATATVSVSPVNDPLVLSVTPETALFLEDSTSAGDRVATSTATDPDGGDITYSIDDTTNYVINATSGTVTLTAVGAAIVNAGGNLPDFNVTAASTTGQTSTATLSANPADTDTNDNPPVAVDDMILTTIDGGDTISIAQGILTRNDYDLDLNDLSITNTYNAQEGVVSGLDPVNFIDHSAFGGSAQEIIENPLDSEDNSLNNDIAHAVEVTRNQFGQVSISQQAEIGNATLPSFKWTGAIDDDGTTVGKTDSDFMKVYLYAGEKIILDIDHGDNGDRNTGTDDQDVDTYLILYDANGNELASNDDASANLGGTGSVSSDYHPVTSLDAYLEYTVTADGYYYVDATAWDNSGNNISDDDGKYDLWISIDPGAGNHLASFDYDITDGQDFDTATVSVNTISDTNQIDGTAGNEILIGTVGEIDVLNGAGGDDEIIVDTTDIVDGGTGFDILNLDTAITLDATTTLDFSNLENIEQIDLATNGNSDVITNLTLDDVLNMTDNNNTLIITGDANDDVQAVDKTGWTKGTETHDTANSTTSYTYSNGADSITLTVDDQIDTTGM